MKRSSRHKSMERCQDDCIVSTKFLQRFLPRMTIICICFSILLMAGASIYSYLEFSRIDVNDVSTITCGSCSQTTTPTQFADFVCESEPEYALFKLNGGAVGCSDNSQWMRLFAANDPSPNKTAIFIGCNKGIDAVDVFAMFDNAATPFNSKLWREAVKGVTEEKSSEGACHQVSKSPDLDRARSNPIYGVASPTVYCVEPLPANVQLLQHCRDETKLDKRSFNISQFAVGNPDKNQKTIGFPEGLPAGYESLGVTKEDNVYVGVYADIGDVFVRVPFTTLDALFGRLDRIDILSVDAEGSDPDVLFAGSETLKRTRYLEFESHRDLSKSPWGTTSLRSVIDFLDDLHFDCFWFNDKGKLFQITRCWHDQYETEAHHWGNVACAKRGDPWHAILSTTRAIQQNMHLK